MKRIVIFTLLVCGFFLKVYIEQANGSVRNAGNTKEIKMVGGGCDGCELMYIGMPKTIQSVDTSPAWHGEGQKLLITGTVYQPDGKTPADNVIIYYWQTDHKGYYTSKAGMDKKLKPHGYVRGWVKTAADGKYSIYTVRPAPYPNVGFPAHIHFSIKEPVIESEYYIDELVFDDDPLLTTEKRRKYPNRGGSGILRVVISDDLQIAEHNIILGLNIPNYPQSIKDQKISGLAIGQDSPSFMPFHAWGPDKGSRTCPVCMYGRYHGIVYFVGNNPRWDEIKKWLLFFEKESVVRKEYLKAYFVYGNENNYNAVNRREELEEIGRELKLTKMAITFIPSMKDEESEVNLYKINSEVESTIILYRHRKIIDKYIDLKPSADNYKLISNRLNETISQYFNLPEPEFE